MTITFRCEHCRKEVKAPDEAAGKRGRCPFCKQASYIPAPKTDEEDDSLGLAPLDETKERRREAETTALRQRERELIAETGGQPAEPLEEKEDLAAEDIHHIVVNYCRDMADAQLQRAETHVAKLKGFGPIGLQAVNDFIQEKVTESALKDIPKPVLKGFLSELREKML